MSAAADERVVLEGPVPATKSSSRKSSLEAYKKKRDFKRTAEPRGRSGKRKRNAPIFVIQKHDASQLHYDFRLEVDGVLKSWAVPKGPSTDPGEKRLAVQTEDHPIAYADFEGVIPEGEYGGGTVVIWDKGTYRNLKEDSKKPVSMADAFENGHVTVWLDGQKLTGGYALTRFRPKNWLLVKMRDSEADVDRDPVRTNPKSVVSGRTIRQVAKAGKPRGD